MYKNNQIYLKLSDGLLEPFTSTISVKQGCVFSPLLFNLFIDKICKIFNSDCDPIQIKNTKLNCLLWADDLLLISETAKGLQNCINQMNEFYTHLGLKINIKKTKVMIFNQKGTLLDDKYKFYLSNKLIEIVDQYQYLGLKVRPSSSLQLAVQELHDKAQRAWFGISHTIFKNKRMEPNKVFALFDSLVTPVALYGCEFWVPYLISKAGFSSKHGLLETWGTLTSETLNQKCSRTILSVHNKASRLAVLGELGRYPLFVNALIQLLRYKHSLEHRSKTPSLISDLWADMSDMAQKGEDCWLLRVNKIVELLNIGFVSSSSVNSMSKRISSIIKSKFESHWIDKINEFKGNKEDDNDHNKLRVYKSFKACFKMEPYLDLVRNRNQRCSLTRLRISAHNLRSETGRRMRPYIPYDQRVCMFCKTDKNSLPNQTCNGNVEFVDNEAHFLTVCTRFENTRSIFFNKLAPLIPGFGELSKDDKLLTLMCPTSAQSAKLINRYIQFMFDKRAKIEGGEGTYGL